MDLRRKSAAVIRMRDDCADNESAVSRQISCTSYNGCMSTTACCE
jgi:hypothetical protein